MQASHTCDCAATIPNWRTSYLEALGRQADFILNYVKYNGQGKPDFD